MDGRVDTQHSMVAQMRQSIFSRLAGYEDTNDAERLAVDPTCASSWWSSYGTCGCFTSQMGRFETEVLDPAEQPEALTNPIRKMD